MNRDEFLGLFRQKMAELDVKEIEIISGGTCEDGCCSYPSEIEFIFTNGVRHSYEGWEIFHNE